MGEIEQRPTPGSRLGAPENSGISTLEHGQKPPPTPSGKLMSIKIQMLDDTQEAFEVPVSWGQPSAWGRSSQSCVSVMHSGGKTVCVFSSPLPTVTMLWFRPSYGFSWLMCVDFLIACAEYKWYQWMCHLNFTLTFHILRHVCICLCVCDVYFWVGGNYGFNLSLISFVVVQSLSHVRLSATPWTAAHQASLFFTISQSLLRFISIESEIPSNRLILCCPLLFLPSIFPSIRVFFNEVALRIKWPKYWSFSTSPSNEYSGLISFRTDWFDLFQTSETCSVVSDSLQPHGPYSPWTSPGQNTGVGSLSLLQGIFPTLGSNFAYKQFL